MNFNEVLLLFKSIKLMNMTPPQKPWLPYLVAIFGMMLSVFLWHMVWHNVEAYLQSLDHYKTYLSWLILLLGISLSILVGTFIRIAQLNQQRVIILKQMHVDLQQAISKRVQAEETKQKLEIAMLQGQKLQAIGTLAGGIAHDFNNILYAIVGYVQMAREDVDENMQIYKNLGKVLEATHRGQELVARILAFSRRQHHQFEIINIKNTIEAALSLLKPTIPASVMVHFETVGDMFISGNQTQIHQVLVNLINNAVDAMEGEGSVNIAITRVTADDVFLKQFPEIRAQNYCKIEMVDTGHGMDKPTIERIFEPFFTTKEVGKGSGLGLSIVHSIIKEHQGVITVTSQLGRGTTFTILLPECATPT